MYALVDYKGKQILIKENEKVKVPFDKNLKIGTNIDFKNVLFFDDGKNKHIGSPYLKSISFQGKVDSHNKESKVIVFKKKRRKGYQKKNGHKQLFTLIQINKLKSIKSSVSKKSTKTTVAKTSAIKAKVSTKKKASTKKVTSTKKTTNTKD